MCTVIVAGLSAALLAVPPFGPYPANGEFEQLERGAFVRWRASAREATVEPQRVRAKWYHFVCDVKTGRFDRIHLYISMAEATEILRISRTAIRWLAKDGKLAAVRVPGRGRYTETTPPGRQDHITKSYFGSSLPQQARPNTGHQRHSDRIMPRSNRPAVTSPLGPSCSI